MFIFGLFSARRYDFWIKGVIVKVLITDNWSLTIVVLRWNLFRRSIYLSSVRVKPIEVKANPSVEKASSLGDSKQSKRTKR